MRFCKKLLPALIFALLFISIPFSAHTNNDLSVVVNGQIVNFPDGQGPVVIDNNLFVPVRGMFETMGFHVNWERVTQTVTLTRNYDNIRFTVGSAVFNFNGVNHALEAPVRLINNRTMLPVNTLLQTVGYTVHTRGNAITISTPAPVIINEPTPPTDYHGEPDVYVDIEAVFLSQFNLEAVLTFLYPHWMLHWINPGIFYADFGAYSTLEWMHLHVDGFDVSGRGLAPHLAARDLIRSHTGSVFLVLRDGGNPALFIDIGISGDFDAEWMDDDPYQRVFHIIPVGFN